MRVDELIPYERNAWDNKAGVPAIATSIKEYGFRGQIKVWSRENPVIISGHHRVLALKELGIEELDDEHIEFCDDMTEDEVKAFRLADNKTGQSGKWNRALSREEVRSLTSKGMDMSKFGFDFKSKVKPYGAERGRTDDYYNLRLVNARHCYGEMPKLEPSDFKPTSLLAFNYAKTAEDTSQSLHFFIDDYQFERLWNKPEQYLDLLQKFEAVLTPDFSLYMDMPLPMQRWNEYRRRALGNYWQRNGIEVIPTLSWSTPESYSFCFDGLPKGATYATSTVGVKGDENALAIWRDGMSAAIKAIKPKRLLLYGGSIDFDFGKIEVVEYSANTAFGRK